MARHSRGAGTRTDLLIAVAVLIFGAVLAGAACSGAGDSEVEPWEFSPPADGAGLDVRSDGGPGPGECESPNFDEDCDAEMDEEACEAHGGEYGRHGLGQEEDCLCRTSDGGCPCRGSEDCDAACIAQVDDDCADVEQGTCAPFEVTFGCSCRVQRDEPSMRICVD